jgi:Holliday junction DNA helicase RuvA
LYEFFEGELVEKLPTSVTLSVNGIGYRFTVPLSTSEALPRAGAVRLLAHLHVREDELRLYGFATPQERLVFEALISVSGIGPALANVVLSGIGVTDFVRALQSRDEARLRRIKGIGAKTAQRILVELGPALPALLERSRLEPSKGGARQDAVLALLSLGFTKEVAEKAVDRALAEGQADDPAEALVRRALRFTG